MKNAARFWDKVANRYAKLPIKNMAAYHDTLARTKRHFSQQDTALELGCGTGSTALLLAPDIGTLTATDISKNMIGIAQKKAADQKISNVKFLQTTLFDARFEAGSFDVILAFNLLHLLEDPKAVIKRAHELLKPHGRFISKTVCTKEISPLWRCIIYVMQRLGLAPGINPLMVTDVDAFFTGPAFKFLDTETYPGTAPSRFIVVEKI